jgi:hypothetical protein
LVSMSIFVLLECKVRTEQSFPQSREESKDFAGNFC